MGAGHIPKVDRRDVSVARPGSRPGAPPPDPRAEASLWARKSELEALGGALVLVAVLGDGESTSDARGALAEWGVPGAPFLVDSGDASKREAGVRDLPTTFVLDGHGTVRWVAPADANAAQIVAAARAVEP